MNRRWPGTLGSWNKSQRQQREGRQTKCLTSSRMALHVRYKPWYISYGLVRLISRALQQVYIVEQTGDENKEGTKSSTLTVKGCMATQSLSSLWAVRTFVSRAKAPPAKRIEWLSFSFPDPPFLLVTWLAKKRNEEPWGRGWKNRDVTRMRDAFFHGVDKESILKWGLLPWTIQPLNVFVEIKIKF